MGISRKAAVVAMATATVALGATGTAQAGTFICVPPQAGVAVVSGGPNGTCDSVSTPVAAADGGGRSAEAALDPAVHPVQGRRHGRASRRSSSRARTSNCGAATSPTLTDGTGNLQVGSGVNDAQAGHSGHGEPARRPRQQVDRQRQRHQRRVS